MCKLVGRDAVTQDLIITDAVSSLGAGISGIALDGVDISILNLLDNAYMIGKTILRPGFAIGRIPVKEDNHAGCWLETSVGPLATSFEPVDAVDATGKLGNDADVNIATLVSTPANKASTPSYARSETIPTPVRLSAHIADLGFCHGNDLLVS